MLCSQQLFQAISEHGIRVEMRIRVRTTSCKHCPGTMCSVFVTSSGGSLPPSIPFRLFIPNILFFFSTRQTFVVGPSNVGA